MKGPTFKTVWEGFSRNYLEEIPDDQRERAKDLFYLGAIAYAEVLRGAVATMTDPEGADLIESLRNEITGFLKEAKLPIPVFQTVAK